jgi:hypothetical protein
LKYILSAVKANHNTLITTSAVVGCVTTISHAVSHTYTGAFIVNAGNAVSALTTQLRSILVASQFQLAASTHIHNIHLGSQSLQAAILASANSHLESVGSK